MTPINDHGFESRQSIIHGPESKRRHYQRCIDRGMSEFESARMSGYHPIDEFDRPFGRFVIWTILLSAIALLALASSDVFASGWTDESAGIAVVIAKYWALVGAIYLAWFLIDAWVHRND